MNEFDHYTEVTDWYVYILRCSDDTLYTGMTNDIERRFKAHNEGKGAKYTRGRLPVVMVYRERCEGRSDALRREAYIKRLTRDRKLLLICDTPGDHEVLT